MPTDAPAPPVPLLNLPAHHAALADDFRDLFQTFVASGQFVLGPYVESFERALADYCGVAHAVGVSSGTDALLVALMALDIGPGDEVVTTPFTFFGTAGTVARLGAKPVFVDIEPDTYNLDASQLDAAVTSKTKAVIPVDLYGQLADSDAVAKVAQRHGLRVVEDAAQAIGARDGKGRAAGSLGDIGCFSFYPTKNLSAMGEAGACMTDDDDLADRMRKLRNHGQTGPYEHAMVGGNFRLDAVQAMILERKLAELDGWTAARRRLAARYDDALRDAPFVTPAVAPGNEHVYHQYTIRAADGRRADLMKHLADWGIGHRVYYPLPLHLQPCFADQGYQRGDFPVAERSAEQVLSLPVYPELTDAQQQRVIDALLTFNG